MAIATLLAHDPTTCPFDDCLTCMQVELGLSGAGETVLAELGRDSAQRTRYAKPGQGSGLGVVRGATRDQANYVKRLLRERDLTNLKTLPGTDLEHPERMSLRGLSDLIDKLLACPEWPWVKEQAERITGAQRGYLDKLLAGKNTDGVDVPDDLGALGRDAASMLIERLKARPWLSWDEQRIRTRGPQLPVGIYRHPEGSERAGQIVRVKKARGKAHVYPTVLVDGSWLWEEHSGAMDGLTEADKLSLEECENLSIDLGQCCLCGITLTATVDGVPPRDRLMGPICEGKMGFSRPKRPRGRPRMTAA